MIKWSNKTKYLGITSSEQYLKKKENNDCPQLVFEEYGLQ